MSEYKNLKQQARQALRLRWSSGISRVTVLLASLSLWVFGTALASYAVGISTPATLFTLPKISSASFWDGSAFHSPALYVTAGSVLLFLLLVPPQRVLWAYGYLTEADGRDSPPMHLRQYLRAVYASIFTVLLRLLTVTPGLLGCRLSLYRLMSLYRHGILSSRLYPVLLIVWGLLTLLVAAGWLVLVQRWALIPYLAMLRPECTLIQLLRLSLKASRGRRFALAGLRLSFIPWFLSCLLVLPVFFVIPYYEQTLAVYARQLLRTASMDGSSVNE